jgi:two-component system NtrC family sensor kinase
MSTRSIRVIIADDNEEFRRAAARFLKTQADLTVVDGVASGAEAIEAAERLQPDVVLMDIAMPGMSGIETTRQLKARRHSTKVILVSMHDSAALRQAAAVSGADGAIGKWEFADAAVSAIRTAVSGTIAGTFPHDARAARLRSLAHLNLLVSATLDTRQVAATIVRAAAELLDAPAVSLWMADETGRTLGLLACSDGEPAADEPTRTIAYGDGLVGRVASERRALGVADLQVDPRRGREDRAGRDDLTSFLGVPLVLEGQLMAVLAAYARRPFDPDPEAQDVLDTFVAHATTALGNARRYARTRNSRDFLRSLARHSADAIIASDAAGSVRYVNPRAETMFGCRSGDILGQDLRVLAKEYVADWQAACAIETRMRGGEEIPHLDIAIHRADGQVVETTWSIARLPGPHGEPAGSVAVIRDVTELRRTQRTLQETERLSEMGSLLAGVAHELNNPLQVIAGHAGLLEGAHADPEQAWRATQIYKAAERCSRIVGNFLAMVRRRPRERRLVALNAVLQEAVELVSYQLRVDGIAIEYDLARRLPAVLGDAHELHQAVVNLLSNARQAMRAAAGPRVLRLSTRHLVDTGQVSLLVADSGPGVSPAIRERIFDPLFTTKRAGEGTGLGLCLCRSIVNAHGGSVGLVPTSGSGAVFEILLPAAPFETTPRATPSAGHPEGTVRHRILVVDDEPEVGDLVADMLRVDGHVVEVTRSAEQALQRVTSVRFDVVVIDIRMPDVDGVELYRRLGQLEPPLSRRVVFMTGDVLTPETAEFLLDSAVVSVEKPFQVGELREAVHRALAVDAR